jgi:hypothetical protein
METQKMLKIVLIIAAVMALAILGLCLFPESAENVNDLMKAFLSLFSFSAAGAISTI